MVNDEKTQELLIRLDERSRAMKQDVAEMKDNISDIQNSFKKDLEKFVTKEQFAPIQRAIYSVATFIVVTVIGTILSFFKFTGHN
jgi:transcription termination factor NusB